MSLTDGYSTLLSQFVARYSNNVTADALVYNYKAKPTESFGVRVEAPTICKEFSNGVKIGRDPTGDLFFDSVDELGVTGGTKDCYFTLQITSSSVLPDQRAFVISFYRDLPEQAFAKFLARDLSGTLTKEFTESTGTWSDLNVGNASMQVTKIGQEKEWSIWIPSLSKIGKFTQPEGTTVHDHVDIWGTLTFKELSWIELSSWVDYRYDRLVFTTSEYQDDDFCAYFIPPEVKDNIKPLGDYNFSSGSVTWRHS